jgi:glycerol-3-phosphate acyltransferase PlsY
MRPVLILIAAYLLGSIPFGYLLVRAKLGADVRETGSGGTGATNVSRRAGKLAGILTLLFDALKGALSVILARMFLTEDFGINWWVAVAVVLAIAGHCFPVWLGFRGGKGVATGVGAFLALSPLAVACAGVVFILIVWTICFARLDHGGGSPAALHLDIEQLREACGISRTAFDRRPRRRNAHHLHAPRQYRKIVKRNGE